MNIYTKITQSLLAFFISLFLSSCGGGGIVADGGIDGTGITSIGRISEFGSIYVNGIRFDVDNASFTRDGKTSIGQSDFSLGEYITIKGTLNPDKISGVASEVTFSDIVEGEVTQITSDGLSIEIIGQLINVTTQTNFHDFNDLNDLVIGNLVEVSGIRDAGGISSATSIKLKNSSFEDGSENELKGTISNINETNKTFQINTITIDYAGASLEDFNNQALQSGQFVEIKSSSAINGNTLIANEIQLENEYQEISESTKVDIEGIVTRFVSISDFDINGIPVSIDVTTIFENGLASDIQLNAYLEIEGVVNTAGLLIAEEVDFQNIVGDRNDTTEESGSGDTVESESGDTEESESDDTEESESDDTEESESGDTEESESGDTEEPESGDTEESESGDTEEPESDNTEEPESDNTEEPESDNTEEPESDNTEEPELDNTNNNDSEDNATN